ncbi:MAG TPA: hypothetical protein VNM37_16125, partial [Candidatus Dormibacteraeota bacterium]|nr:hypothetical protein [Candidatus Dormibacteraeota bacterium]
MKLRLTGFLLLIGLLVSLIVWATVVSWKRVDESRARLTAVQSESFQIASHLQQTILRLNERLLSSLKHRDTNDAAQFESEWAA